MVTNRRTLDLRPPFSMATETLSLILEIAVLSCEPCCDRGEVRVAKPSSDRSFELSSAQNCSEIPAKHCQIPLGANLFECFEAKRCASREAVEEFSGVSYNLFMICTRTVEL